MKRGLVSACAALLVGSGWSLAQAPMPVTPNPSSTPSVRQVQAIGLDMQGGIATGEAIPAPTIVPPAPVDPGAAPGILPTVPPSGVYGLGPTGPLAAPGGPPAPPPGLPTAGPLPAANFSFEKPPHGERDYLCDQYIYYANFDYLLWRINNPIIPQAASITPAGVAMVPVPGAVPPVTQLLSIGAQLGQGPSGVVNLGEHNGGRLTIGCWCDPERWLGFEAQAVYLEKLTFGFNTVFNNNNNATNALVINTGLPLPVIVGGMNVGTQNLAFIGTSSGALQGSLSQMFASGELNVRSTWLTFANTRFGFLAGFRTLYFEEDFSLRDTYTLTIDGAGGVILFGGGNTLAANSFDSINCRNNFYGFQGGLEVESVWGQAYFQARVKGAVGAMRQTVDIKSASLSPTPTLGGIIFGPGDVGERLRTRISGIPEANLKVGYQFCHWLRAYVGWDGIYVYNVIRPANQLAPGTNVQVNVAGTGASANVSQNTFNFSDSNLMIQGVSFGLELRY